jgi:hypothetical protein
VPRVSSAAWVMVGAVPRLARRTAGNRTVMMPGQAADPETSLARLETGHEGSLRGRVRAVHSFPFLLPHSLRLAVNSTTKDEAKDEHEGATPTVRSRPRAYPFKILENE